MKNTKIIFLSMAVIAMVTVAFKSFSPQEGKEPWAKNQLIQPAELAKIINEKTTFIFNIGPAGLIKNAIEIGEGSDEKNVAKLKNEVSKLPKDANIVIYCGCCPFGDCPNIRPTFKLLNDLKFTNHKLLNLPKNLKVDWIDKGFPMNEK
ncbi:MAG: rhodanese-like domain-containing protein [Bacteroidetes bacterium]|nr:rhodanese-like domain-containing protein [Bacteroidota bacterium]